MAGNGERPLFIRLSLPAGLEESLEGLAREVLRAQPKDLHRFAADHFEAKLKIRNQGDRTHKGSFPENNEQSSRPQKDKLWF